MPPHSRHPSPSRVAARAVSLLVLLAAAHAQPRLIPPALEPAIYQAIISSKAFGVNFRAAAEKLGLSGAIVTGNPLDGPIDLTRTCDILNLMEYNFACLFLGVVETAIIALGDVFKCSNMKQSGYGDQVQPPAAAKDGSQVPAPLVDRRPVPVQFTDADVAALLPAESPTYLWLWGTINNMYAYWPCSKEMGGSYTGYLYPNGWQPAGSGIITLYQRLFRKLNANVPFTVMMVNIKTKQMVISIRGTQTTVDWMTDFAYNRTSNATFSGSAFEGSSFGGETHAGFTRLFMEVWPAISAALQGYVTTGDVTNVIVTGHSLGAAVGVLVADAVARWLRAGGLASTVQLDAVLFATPNVGDSAYAATSTNGVNMRNLVFVNDLVTYVPCGSSNGGKGIPACFTTPVKTASKTGGSLLPLDPFNPLPDPFGGSPYWSDYQRAWGAVSIQPAALPVQQDAWAGSKDASALSAGPYVIGNHYCAYQCFSSQHSSCFTGNQCLLKDPPTDGFSFCPNFPLLSIT